MKAMICDDFGDAGAMREAEVPCSEPAEGEVLLRVRAAGVNRADVLQRMGKYPPPAGASDILGLEVAGEVVGVGGGVSRWRAGDRVCALLGGGGYAEYVCAPDGQCLPMPSGLSFAEAASLPEAAFTAWANLFEAGGLKGGEAVLIHGGAGGMGSFAVQIAAAGGCKVFATAGSDEKAAFCLRLGAAKAINYRSTDFVAAITEMTGGRGVDVVWDVVGGEYVGRNLGILAEGGRHVSIAVQGGKKAEIDLLQIMRRRLVLTGSTLRNRAPLEKARICGLVEANIWPLVAKNAVRPTLGATFPMKEAALAHKMMESGELIGKIALEVA